MNKILWELKELFMSRGLMIFICMILSVVTSMWIMLPIAWIILQEKMIEKANQSNK